MTQAPITPPCIPEIELAGQGGSHPEALIRLDGTNSTLLLIRRREGLPEIAYWGRRLPQEISEAEIFAVRAPDSPNNGPDQWRPLITLLDTIGCWNFDMPGLIAARPDGSGWTANFETEQVAREGQRLVVRGKDTVSGLALVLNLELGPDDVLTSQARLSNTGTQTLRVERLVSGTYLLPESVDTAHVLSGEWGNEFGIEPMNLTRGGIVVESRRNRTHDHFPGMLLSPANTAENEGEAWAVQLGWSGGHRLCVERMEDGRVRLSCGEYLYSGEGDLAPGAELVTPVAYAAYSSAGFSGCARAFQAHARRHVLHWQGGKMKPRPVLLNSWEGSGFDLHEDQLMRQVDAAAALGIERFVLDDGWFGARRDCDAGLGDWFSAASVFPNGLRPLADRIHGHGMEFGLWYEPEMVNPDSDLYRAHPDWVLQTRGYPLWTSRNQLVLDISRPEVSDYLFEAISEQVASVRIDYIKWDFNRDLVEASDAQGRAAYRRQVLALYALWERLHKAHPELEIESCASGGGRADWGALAHTQRVWTSDDTDALERLAIQGAAWHFLPPEVTGCHISEVPNGITGRTTTLDFRACVAIFGHLGLELDPTHLSAEESTRLKAWIALHKRLRGLLHHGQAQFCAADPARVVRGVVSDDARSGVFLVAQRDWVSARRPSPIRLSGLDPAKTYRITLPEPQNLPAGYRPSEAQKAVFSGKVPVSGATLMDVGIFPPFMPPLSAMVMELQAV